MRWNRICALNSVMSAAEINVSVRIKPLLSRQIDGKDGKERSSVVDVTQSGTVVVHGEEFRYPSHVVMGSDQTVAFEALASVLIDRVCAGYNATLMAYGQTGSGKTHTMFGPPGCLTEAAVHQVESGNSIPDTWGLFPRAVLTLMQIDGVNSLHASAIEVYHEQVFDLLDNKSALQISNTKPMRNKVAGNVDIGGNGSARATNGMHPASCTCHACFKVQEAKKEAATKERMARAQKAAEAKTSKSSRVSSLPSSNACKPGRSNQDIFSSFATVGEKLIPLRDAEDVARFARTIEATRTAKSHLLNDRSSRSHCLVKVHISRVGATGKSCRETSKVTTLLFVDLAGSERIKRSGAEGIAMEEAQSINTSLSALGRVIKSLGSKGSQHVPYRDAALTMLLRDSFGGKSCTSVVINIAGEQNHSEESVCSLKFGQRMSIVRNSPTIVIDSDIGNTAQLESMLQSASYELEQMRVEGLGGGFLDSAIKSEKASLTDNMRKLEVANKDVRHLVSQIAEARGRGISVAEIVALEQKLQACRSQADVFQAIVERQQTIKTLWAVPTPAFKRKEGEVKELEGRMLVAISASQIRK